MVSTFQASNLTQNLQSILKIQETNHCIAMLQLCACWLLESHKASNYRTLTYHILSSSKNLHKCNLYVQTQETQQLIGRIEQNLFTYHGYFIVQAKDVEYIIIWTPTFSTNETTNLLQLFMQLFTIFIIFNNFQIKWIFYRTEGVKKSQSFNAS